MTAKPRNIIVIMADEHARQVLGAYGNPHVKTPNLDRLAAQGALFENAYCNNPICVPSRASFATGRYTFETGHWDNSKAYQGEVPAWGHRLIETGHRAVSIGKLHYRNETDPTGFSEQILPMHIHGGVGMVTGLLRERERRIPQLAGQVARGDSEYLQYDRDIRDATVTWLEEAAAKPDDRPWALFVSFVCPHFPLVAPPEFYDLIDPDTLPLPDRTIPENEHPAVAGMRRRSDYDSPFNDDPAHIRRALAAYYGMVAFQDANVGKILETLAATGLDRDTLVVYTADHGDNLGQRRLWGKSNMFEESAGVPMIVAGPGVAPARVKTPVSLVDLFPTIIEAVGQDPHPGDATLPGRSLLRIGAEPDDPDRTVFVEYHTVGTDRGHFLVRWDRYKYIHYEGYAPQLFDLETDPAERDDLASDPAYAAALDEGRRRLHAICDPAEVDRAARADQQARIEALGGAEKLKDASGFSYFTPAPGRSAA